MLIEELTEFSVIKRSVKGTGFDYWLATKDNIEELPFVLESGDARLEVSGILRGSEIALTKRVKAKLKQTKRSDKLAIPGYIVVVEFSNPMAQVVVK